MLRLQQQRGEEEASGGCPPCRCRRAQGSSPTPQGARPACSVAPELAEGACCRPLHLLRRGRRALPRSSLAEGVGTGREGEPFPASGATLGPGLGMGAPSPSSPGPATVPPPPRTSAAAHNARRLELMGAPLTLPGQPRTSLALGFGTRCPAPGLPDCPPGPGSRPGSCISRKGRPACPALLLFPCPLRRPPAPSLGFWDQGQTLLTASFIPRSPRVWKVLPQ